MKNLSNFIQSSTKNRPNRPDFMDDPKKNRKKNLLSKFQNGPIRKVNMLKSKFDDIFVPAPLCHPGSALRKFFDRKKNRNFFFSSTQNGPIRKVNRLKSKCDDIFVHESSSL